LSWFNLVIKRISTNEHQTLTPFTIAPSALIHFVHRPDKLLMPTPMTFFLTALPVHETVFVAVIMTNWEMWMILGDY
jgi:hypothetical protein